MTVTALLAILFLSAAPVRAGGAGDAMPFLKLDSGARGAALSGAYCAAGDDALSVFYNPAGTALARKKEVLLGHNEWLEGIRNETLAYVHPLGPRLTAFTGINALLSGSMDRYDALGGRTGSFSSMEAAVSLGFSADLGRSWYGGAALKALSQQAAGDKAMAWAGDFGLLRQIGEWRVAASASNFGSGLKFARDKFDLPLMLRGGVSYTFLENYTVAAEEVKAGGSAAATALGAEARLRTGPKEYFSVRAGYKTGRSRNAGPGFTAGVGLGNRELKVDYAFVPYGDLGDSHRVTVSFRFGADRLEKFSRASYYGLPPPRAKRRAEQKGTDGKKEKAKDGSVYFMW